MQKANVIKLNKVNLHSKLSINSILIHSTLSAIFLHKIKILYNKYKKDVLCQKIKINNKKLVL